MLGRRDKTAPLVATTLPGLTAQPQEFKYGAANPTIEQTFNFSDLSGGFGQKYVRGRGDETRYFWAGGVDASIQGVMQPGPEDNSLTSSDALDTTNGISDFWEMTSAGTLKLFTLNGRYAKVRNGDTAATIGDLSKDFGAGKVATDVIVVKQTGGSTTYTLVAMGSTENFWSYDGTSDTTTWAQHATLQASCWAVAPNEFGTFLWRADGNYVYHCDLVADFLTAGNWSAGDPVGDATSDIVRMVVHPDGTLYIFKTDGIYVFLPDGSSKRLYSGLATSPSAENGRWQFVYENWIHTTFGGSHFRIGPGGSIEPIGPERAIENDSAIRGYITAGCGTPFAAYTGLYDPDGNDCYLVKFGGWVTGDDGSPHRIDAWHGALDGFLDQKITAMKVSSIGASSNHQRLYYATSTGVVHFFPLSCVPNPASCTNYRWKTGGSPTLTFSYWDGGYPIDNKHFHWGAVAGSRLSATAYALLYVGFNEDFGAWGASYTPLGTHHFDSSPGERKEFIADQIGANISVTLILANTTNTTAPLIHSVGFAYSLRPLMSLVYEFSIIAEDGQLKLDGSRMSIGASKIRSLVKSYATTVGSVTVYLPDHDGVSMELAIISYEEGIAWDRRSTQWKAALHCVAVQSSPLTENYGATSAVLGS